MLSVCIAAILSVFLLGCEKENTKEQTTTSNEAQSVQEAEGPAKKAPEAKKKLPESLPEYFGPVKLGMTQERAVDLLGEPEKREEGKQRLKLIYPSTFKEGASDESSATYLFMEGRGLVLVMNESTNKDTGLDTWRSDLEELEQVLGEPSGQLVYMQVEEPFRLPFEERYETGRIEIFSNWKDEGRSAYGFSFGKGRMPAFTMAEKSVLGSMVAGFVMKGDLVRLSELKQIGRPFELGKFEYIIESVTRPKKVGDGRRAKAASEGAEWVVVRYTIENVGKKTATALSGDLLLRDKQGREFSPSAEGSTAISMSEDIDLALSQLQPGIKKKQAAVFEVPSDAAAHFEIIVPEKGLAGDETKVLNFRFTEAVRQRIKQAE